MDYERLWILVAVFMFFAWAVSIPPYMPIAEITRRASEEVTHKRYLDTIEETVKGLETRLQAIENWKKCQQEKEDGHRSLDPRDGKGFVGQGQSTMKVGDVIGHSIWPNGIPLETCCFGFEADRECDESNRCRY
jgi:hypothetical protein